MAPAPATHRHSTVAVPVASAPQRISLLAHRQRLRRQHQLQLGSIDEGPYGGYTDDAFDGAGPPPDTAGSADSADGGAPPPDGAGLSVDDARPDSADEPPPGSG